MPATDRVLNMLNVAEHDVQHQKSPTLRGFVACAERAERGSPCSPPALNMLNMWNVLNMWNTNFSGKAFSMFHNTVQKKTIAVVSGKKPEQCAEHLCSALFSTFSSKSCLTDRAPP